MEGRAGARLLWGRVSLRSWELGWVCWQGALVAVCRDKEMWEMEARPGFAVPGSQLLLSPARSGAQEWESHIPSDVFSC